MVHPMDSAVILNATIRGCVLVPGCPTIPPTMSYHYTALATTRITLHMKGGRKVKGFGTRHPSQQEETEGQGDHAPPFLFVFLQLWCSTLLYALFTPLAKPVFNGIML